jgi:hypothetical protein
MSSAIQELKVRAEILHKQIKEQNILHVKRLRALAECRRFSEEQLMERASTIRRRDCLAVVAAELGFSNWQEAKAAVSGDPAAREFGTLLYPRRSGHINHWFARYEDAAPMREASDGYLLAYKHQFLVVDRFYIESLGVDPDDEDWRELGFDWVRPASVAARTRLYAKVVAALPRQTV